MINSVLYNQRFKKARDVALLLSNFPFVRRISLTGSMAKKNIRPNSDIDFFIQTKKGRIWTTRALIVFFLSIIGEYRTNTNVAGKICPNWYATYDAPKKNHRQYQTIVERNGFFSRISEIILSNKIGDLLEKKFKQYQVKRIVGNPKTYKKGSQVRFSDSELGFHPHNEI